MVAGRLRLRGGRGSGEWALLIFRSGGPCGRFSAAMI
jgi:hypothetical protein